MKFGGVGKKMLERPTKPFMASRPAMGATTMSITTASRMTGVTFLLYYTVP
jgi:hypothetical protein